MSEQLAGFPVFDVLNNLGFSSHPSLRQFQAECLTPYQIGDTIYYSYGPEVFGRNFSETSTRKGICAEILGEELLQELFGEQYEVRHTSTSLDNSGVKKISQFGDIGINGLGFFDITCIPHTNKKKKLGQRFAVSEKSIYPRYKISLSGLYCPYNEKIISMEEYFKEMALLIESDNYFSIWQMDPLARNEWPKEIARRILASSEIHWQALKEQFGIQIGPNIWEFNGEGLEVGNIMVTIEEILKAKLKPSSLPNVDLSQS